MRCLRAGLGWSGPDFSRVMCGLNRLSNRGVLLILVRWNQRRRWGDGMERRLANAHPRMATGGPGFWKSTNTLLDGPVKSVPARRRARGGVRYWPGQRRVSWLHSARGECSKRAALCAECRSPRLSSEMLWGSHSADPNTDQCLVPMPRPLARICVVDTSRSLPQTNVPPD